MDSFPQRRDMSQREPGFSRKQSGVIPSIELRRYSPGHAAEDSFRAWRCTSLADRQHCVAEFLRLLKESREELARIVTLENGKTIRESRAEVDSALIEGTYH
ncbi:MAG: aldehyde dehydrogenase family protein [Acidobacteria bacterium]|nr:aldehyde dehydrogenase family protein [Acidobacteriota bacterium]